MKNDVLRIIIFDGSFKTTPFINCLAKGLAVKHQVYILGFNEEMTEKIEGVEYKPLGNNQNKFRFGFTSLEYAIRTSSIKIFFSTIKSLIKGKRQQLQEQNLCFVLKQIEPDIIHLQWPSVISWFEEVLEEQKIPVVLSQRGFHSNVRPFVDNANFEYLKKWYPKMAGFHSVSKAIAINGDKIWHSPYKINKVIYTGLDLREIPFSKEYTLSKPLKLISIGRGHWIKGYDYALRTCKLLEHERIPFQYTIIGGAENEELQFMINDLGLQDNVILKSRMPQRKVFSLMQEASLLLMPSLEEGIPNVVVEAMAIGLPVIGTDCGGMREVVENDKEGWIVPIRNPKAMADAIVSLINSPISEIEKVRFNARFKVETQHTTEKMIIQMEELYNIVLSNYSEV